jgi:hypothetical protein
VEIALDLAPKRDVRLTPVRRAEPSVSDGMGEGRECCPPTLYMSVDDVYVGAEDHWKRAATLAY